MRIKNETIKDDIKLVLSTVKQPPFHTVINLGSFKLNTQTPGNYTMCKTLIKNANKTRTCSDLSNSGKTDFFFFF